MKPKGKYNPAFSFTMAAKNGDFIPSDYSPFMANRILSGSHIFLANNLNELNMKTVGNSVMADLVFRFFRDKKPYGQYFKVGREESTSHELLAKKLSDILGCPHKDASIYITKGIYKEKDINEEWSDIYELD